MNLKLTLAGVVLLAVLMSGGAAAQACSDSELYGHMETMKEQLRGISGAVRSGDMSTAQALVPDMLDAARQAQRQTPYSLRDGSSDDLMDFQVAIGELVAMVEILEAALAQENAQVAAMTLREIGDLQRNGHRRFKHRSC